MSVVFIEFIKVRANKKAEVEGLSVSLLVYQHVLATSLTLPVEMLISRRGVCSPL